MLDEKILFKFLNYELTNEHPAVYLYCLGQKRNQKIAIDVASKVVFHLFCPPYTPEFIIKVIINFLEYKKSEYTKGNINITPIYQ